jgi:MiaB/RimO family radical SAM methylthiotransferase
MKKGPYIYVNYHGCEKRKLDAQRILEFYKANGYKYSGNPNLADVIVYVTCAFCKSHEDLSVQKFNKIYSKKSPNAQVILSGCLPAINPSRVREKSDILMIGPRELEKFDALVTPLIHSISTIRDPNETQFEGRKENHKQSNKIRKGDARDQYDRARLGYKIRINWGCVGNCSYCVTKLATLGLKSKSIAEVVDEFKKGYEKGEKSFFITGGDTGAFGIDNGSSIVELLQEIFNFPGPYQLHFHDFGVHWLLKYFDELIPLFQTNADKLGCFNFPIQSGSNRILQLMRRPYKIEDVQEKLQILKSKVPQIRIGTHFIVGFPGETDEDFELSKRLVSLVPFDFLMVFEYTDHEKADSAKFPNKITSDIISQRYTTLFDFFEEKQQKHNHLN